MGKEAETRKELLEDPADLRRQLADVKKSRSETIISLQALQASETRYRRLFETAQDGILILNAETGQIEDVNPYLIDMLHYSYEEFMGMKLWEVSPFKNTVLNIVAFQELQDKGYIRYKDLPLETKEGKPVSVEFVSNVYKVNGNKVIQCNIRNTNESREAKQKLQEAVIFQQRLIDAMPVPVFYKDSEGRYLGCNRSFETFFGQKREQVTGKSVYDLSPKEIADIYHEKDLTLLQNPGIQVYESTVKDTDGVVHNVLFHKATFSNTDGSVGGLIGAILDITDRKQSEEALRESEEKFSRAFQTSPYGITITSPKDGKIVEVNDAFISITGFTREEALAGSSIGMKLWANEDDRQRVVAALQAGRAIVNQELQFRTKSGEVIMGLFSAQMIHLSRGLYILSSINDITERKRAEKQLRDTLESLRNAVGATIQVMVSAVESRDPYTAGHQIRSANLARAIATEMELSLEKIEGIRMAGSIHDIGKLSVPAEILSKPTKLSKIEFSLIQEHARQGYEILKNVESPWPLAEIVHQHH
jgi:PAS domain S-box-containing protein